MKLLKDTAKLFLLLPVLFLVAILTWVVFLLFYKFVIINSIGTKILLAIMGAVILLSFRK